VGVSVSRHAEQIRREPQPRLTHDMHKEAKREQKGNEGCTIKISPTSEKTGLV